jgi:hypothetical protein
MTRLRLRSDWTRSLRRPPMLDGWQPASLIRTAGLNDCRRL